MRLLPVLALLGLATATPVCPAAAQSTPRRDAPAALRRTLDSLAAAHRGVVGYSITNLATGEHLERKGDETFPTASLIKVPILVTLFDLAEQKQLSLDDPVVLTPIDKVGGAGELQFLRTPATFRLWDIAWFMSTLSDNTGTNLILDRIKIRRVWQKMEALGLPHTKVHSGSMTRIGSVAPDSSAKYGLGVTTPNEMAQLFTLLAEGKAVSATADSTMLDILANNRDDMKLARFAYGVPLAHKTGDVDQARADCGVFTLPAKVVACVLTKENADTRYWGESEGNTVIARIGEAVVKTWRTK
ncbi:MAG: class A beta-lactamase-related serine hydrolase [Gemmatimonadaceae bacterium]|nr:class A beta-lactamase-related serine hydrolase [Gemmatimonadaceae bacterium]